MIMETGENDDYVVKLDGSGRLSKHTRRHLRHIRALDSVPPQYTPSYAGHRAGDAPADDESKKYYESKKTLPRVKKILLRVKKTSKPHEGELDKFVRCKQIHGADPSANFF